MSTSNNFVHPQYHNRPFDDRPIDKAPSAAKLPAPSGGGSDASPSPDTFACYETPALLHEITAPKVEDARKLYDVLCEESSRRVLVVDDDPSILRSVRRQLERAGWKVTTSESPIPCAGFEVVLTDWSPWGEQMCKQAEAYDVPVVVFTADPTNVTVRVAVVSKPWGADELEATLRGAVRHG